MLKVPLINLFNGLADALLPNLALTDPTKFLSGIGIDPVSPDS
jgi:hypothetical protein